MVGQKELTQFILQSYVPSCHSDNQSKHQALATQNRHTMSFTCHIVSDSDPHLKQ